MQLHKNKRTLLLFIIPAAIPLVIFWIYPILSSLFISFTNWDYMTPTYDFVGLQNYIFLLQDSSFYQALINTISFSILSILPTIVVGLFLALLLKSTCKGKKIYQTILFSPWITPTVAISIVWVWIYNPDSGIANVILSLLQLKPMQWLNSSETAMIAVVLVTLWKSIGYAMIFYLTALEKVPAELYEAAGVDGAGSVKKFFKITLPLISPTTFFLIIMTTINSLQAYDQIQILTQGGPSGSTRTLLYLYYQFGFEQFHMGQAAATAVLLIIITGVLSVLQFIASKKLVHY